MPKLAVDVRATGVNSINNLLPSGDLFLVPDTRGVGPFCTIQIALIVACTSHYIIVHSPLLRDQGTLSDDKASTAALFIVLAHEIIRNVCRHGSTTSESRHEDSVLQGQRTEFDGFSESSHG